MFGLATTLGGLTSPEILTRFGFVSPETSFAFSTITIIKQHKNIN